MREVRTVVRRESEIELKRAEDFLCLSLHSPTVNNDRKIT
jgi:hypothetical protein